MNTTAVDNLAAIAARVMKLDEQATPANAFRFGMFWFKDAPTSIRLLSNYSTLSGETAGADMFLIAEYRTAAPILARAWREADKVLRWLECESRAYSRSANECNSAGDQVYAEAYAAAADRLRAAIRTLATAGGDSDETINRR